MGYPIAYRSGARKYQSGGFQNPLTVPPGRGPGKPANDNWPKPANDNEPGAGAPKSFVPKIENPWPGFAADAAEEALRRLIPPQYRILFDAAELGYSIWSADRQQMPTVRLENGLTKQCGYATPPAAYRGSYRWHFGNFTTLCGLGGQALGNGQTEPPMYAGDRYGNWGPFIAKASADGLSDSMQRSFIVAKFHKWPNPANSPAFQIRWDFPMRVTGPLAPLEMPEPLPGTWANPIPEIVPKPIGYTVPSVAPMPATVPRPNTLPWRVPVSRVEPNHWPTLKPVTNAPVVVVAPGTVTNPVRKPPGPGVKERKVRASGAVAGALGIAAGIYEDAKFYNDVLNAWYDALPSKYQRPGLRPDQKAAAIYLHYDKIDVQKAIIGVMIVIAGEKAGAYIDRARRVAGDNLGLNMYISIPTGSAPRL